jgi:nitrogen regulatory protein P-II 1
MSYLAVLVLDDPDQCDDLLNAWEKAGAGGVTILESTGIGRIRRGGIRDDIPLMPSISDLFRGKETHHRTLFSVVESAEKAEELRQATESVVGSLDNPHTGLMFVIELYKVFGMGKE